MELKITILQSGVLENFDKKLFDEQFKEFINNKPDSILNPYFIFNGFTYKPNISLSNQVTIYGKQYYNLVLIGTPIKEQTREFILTLPEDETTTINKMMKTWKHFYCDDELEN